eukprot:Gb_35631 [translate_table: standard]
MFTSLVGFKGHDHPLCIVQLSPTRHAHKPQGRCSDWAVMNVKENRVVFCELVGELDNVVLCIGGAKAGAQMIGQGIGRNRGFNLLDLSCWVKPNTYIRKLDDKNLVSDGKEMARCRPPEEWSGRCAVVNELNDCRSRMSNDEGKQNSSMNGNAEEIVCSILHGDGDVKIRAAEEIRRMTKTSAKSREYLAAAGVIIPLVSMLKSTNMEAKEAAVLALLNLAVKDEGSALDHIENILEGLHGLQYLMGSLGFHILLICIPGPGSIGGCYLFRVLGPLSPASVKKSRNKDRILKAGAIEPLVEILESEVANLREIAAAAILTLSASATNKPIIGSSGATPLLVEMLTSGSLQGKVDALMALYNLSMYPDNLLIILAAEAAPPLIALLKECKKSSKVAEKATALLESLSAFEEGRTTIAKEEGGILTLVEVIEDGSLKSREHAVGALLTMCQSSRCKYREAILQEGVIPGLLELTIQGTPKAQQKAHTLLQFLRDSHPLAQTTSASNVLESIVYDIAAHVDGVEKGTETSKKILTEMVQVSMEQSMRHLQQRALVCIPTEISRSNSLAKVRSE